MRLVSWNVNGIRSLRKDLLVTINELRADIACFQETKIAKEMMTENLAIIDGYRSYYSFCKTRSGYSGVATYCTKDMQPVSATDSLTTALSGEGELSFGLAPDVLKVLDCEGRTIITQHSLQSPVSGKSLLTVVNVYCPCVTGEKDGREAFRLQFLQTLEERVVQLQRVSHVLVVGDINISHRIIDHCDPGDELEFTEQPHRQWLDRVLNPEHGLLLDSFRELHPEKKFAYTCWNTKIGARQTNFGTRIDYVMIDRDLKTSLTSAEVLSKYLGSDHCPVSVDLSLDVQPSVKPPALCSSHRYKAKQQKLTMFLKKSSGQPPADIFDSLSPATTPSAKSNHKKRKTGNKKVSNTLNGFVKKKKEDTFECSQSSVSDTAEGSQPSISGESDISPLSDENSQNSSQSSANEAWSKIFSKKSKELPICSGHKEKCILRTVKKAGDNMGRQFYSCSRPAGRADDQQARCSYFSWADNS